MGMCRCELNTGTVVARRGVRSLGAGLPEWVLGLNLGPLQEPNKLSAAEPSLQPPSTVPNQRVVRCDSSVHSKMHDDISGPYLLNKLPSSLVILKQICLPTWPNVPGVQSV